MLIGQTPRGPLGGPQSTPETLRGKKFCLQKGGSNDSECFDLPRSTIVKNTFLKKKLRNFSLSSIWCKNSEYRIFRLFCRCQFWTKTSFMFFFWIFWFIWRVSGGVLIVPTPRGAPGGPQSTPGALRGKMFPFKSGVQTTQNALIIHWKSIRGSAHWTNPKGGPQGALKVPLGPYTEEH